MCLSACSTIHLFDVWFFLKEHKEKDREKGAIHAWLEDHVVTDTVYVATEDIVWEALWDQARKLKKREIVSFFFHQFHCIQWRTEKYDTYTAFNKSLPDVLCMM